MVSSGGERSPSPAKPEPPKDEAPPPSSAGAQQPPAERKRSRTPERRRTRSRSRSHSRGRRHYDSRSRSRSKSPQRRRSRTRSPRSRSRSHSPENDDGLRLHVADLDNNASKRDLERLFGKYGPLKEIWMARSTPCFAFVVYRYREDAAEACRYTDGVDLCGRRVRVTVAKPRTRGRGRRSFDPAMRCYQCGDRGHFSRDCPDSRYGYKRGGSRDRDRDRGERRGRY